jgi:CRP-like cAMP-binding protein
MQINALIEPLLNVPLFHGLKPLQITEIARRADRIVFKPGDVIVAENATGAGAVLIVSGEAVRYGQILPAGTLLGETAMLIETGFSATVVARTEVRAIRITRSELSDQMHEDPALAAHLADKMTARLDVFLKELRQIDSFLTPVKAPAEATLSAVPETVKSEKSNPENAVAEPAAEAPALPAAATAEGSMPITAAA